MTVRGLIARGFVEVETDRHGREMLRATMAGHYALGIERENDAREKAQ